MVFVYFTQIKNVFFLLVDTIIIFNFAALFKMILNKEIPT